MLYNSINKISQRPIATCELDGHPWMIDFEYVEGNQINVWRTWRDNSFVGKKIDKVEPQIREGKLEGLLTDGGELLVVLNSRNFFDYE